MRAGTLLEPPPLDEDELRQSPGAASEIAPLPPALSCVGEEDVELLPASASAADAGAALKTLSAASRADRVRAMTRDEAAVVLQARQRGNSARMTVGKRRRPAHLVIEVP